MNKEGWEIKELGEICTFMQGVQIGVELQYTEPSPQRSRFLRISDYTTNNCEIRYVDKQDDKYYISEDDVVIVRYGASAGFVGTNKKGVLANNLFRLNQDKSLINNIFLLYCLSTSYYKTFIQSVAFGAAMPALSFKSLSVYPIPVPPLPIQEQIVAELDALNDILAKKRQQLTELDTLAQATFYDLFGDPVENEKGWEVKRLEEVAHLKAGLFVKASEISNIYEDGLYKCFGANGLRGYVSTFTHEGNYVLIGRQGALCGNVTLAKGKFHATEHAVVVSPLIQINSIWLLYELDSLNLNQYATGAAQPGLSVNKIVQIYIPLPPHALQNQFAEQIEAIEKQKELINQSITEVQKLLDYTMDKYFN